MKTQKNIHTTHNLIFVLYICIRVCVSMCVFSIIFVFDYEFGNLYKYRIPLCQLQRN